MLCHGEKASHPRAKSLVTEHLACVMYLQLLRFHGFACLRRHHSRICQIERRVSAQSHTVFAVVSRLIWSYPAGSLRRRLGTDQVGRCWLCLS